MGLFVVVALGLGMWVWKKESILRRIDQTRVEAMAEDAFGRLEAGDYEAAGKLLRRAFVADSDNPEVLRGVAAYYKLGDPKQAIHALRSLWSQGEATSEDGLNLLRHYDRMGRLTDADPFCDELVERYPEDVEILYEASRLQRRLGRRDAEQALLERVRVLDPDHVGARFAHAVLKVESPLRDVVEAGHEEILEIAEREDEMGLEALLYLQENREGVLMAEEKYLDLLRGHPMRERAVRGDVAILEWELALDGTDAEERVMAALEEWGERHGEEALAPRVHWAIEAGYSEEAADFLDEERLGRMPMLFFLCLDARTKSGDSGAAHELLDTFQRGGRRIPASLGRAALYADEKRSQSMIFDELEAAMVMAELERKDMYLVLAGQLATRIGQYKQAIKAFEKVKDEHPLEAHRGLALLCEKKGDYRGLLSHMIELCELDRGNKMLQSRTAYLRMLLNSETSEAIEYATGVLEENPADSRARIILGLWHHRQGNGSAAVGVCEGIRADALLDGERAVLAGIYQANGEQGRADELMVSLDEAVLLPEEKAMLSSSAGEVEGES
ncbi:MAG: tetratricopeptide repeat protein [Verrucomicrobiota bacterium]